MNKSIKDIPLRIIGTLIISLGWFFFMLSSFVHSIADGDLETFVSHFTNWSWTIQMVFYYFLNIGFLFSDRLLDCVVSVFFIPVWGMSWIVAILVLLLELRNGNFVLDSVIYHKSGLVFFGNDLYHFIPPVIFGLIVIGMSTEFTDVFKDILKKRTKTWIGWIGIMAYLLLSPLVAIGIYMLIYDYKVIYQTSMPIYQGILISVSVSFIVDMTMYWILTADNISDCLMRKRTSDNQKENE